jgi:hypothetical protein
MSKGSSYWVAREVCEGTGVFCGRFMVCQSAELREMLGTAKRIASDAANWSIAPGAREQLKTAVSGREGFERLMRGYEDYMRYRKVRPWTKESGELAAVKEMYKLGLNLYRRTMGDGETDGILRKDPYRIGTVDDRTAANTMLYLCGRGYALLSKEIQKLEKSSLAKAAAGEPAGQAPEEPVKREVNVWIRRS